MAAVTRTVLKSYFNTGDTPTEGQFANLIDSMPLAEDEAFNLFAGTTWDGTNRKLILSSNMVVSVNTTRSAGVLLVVQDSTGSRTLTVGGTLVPVNTAPGSYTFVAFEKVIDQYFLIVDTSAVLMGSVTSGGGTGDTTAPTIVSVTATGIHTFRVVFSESVTATIAGWLFGLSGSEQLAPTSVSGSGTTWDFTVSQTYANGQSITWGYVQASGATKDAANNPLADASGSVTNSIAAGGGTPTLVALVPTSASGTITDNGDGTYTATNVKGIFAGKLAAGQAGYIQDQFLTLSAQNTVIIGLDAATGEEDYTVIDYAGYIDGLGHYAKSANGATSTADPLTGGSNFSPASGDLMRINKTLVTGGLMNITLENSSDGGTTWTPIFNIATGVTDVDLYPKVQWYQSGATTLAHPKGYNIS